MHQHKNGTPLRHISTDLAVDPNSILAQDPLPVSAHVDRALCPVEIAGRIIGQKWTLQIVYTLIDGESRRFCELQEALGGVNPSTLSSRLKYLEELGMVQRIQVRDIPPHVEYRLTEMGRQLNGVIREIIQWSRAWLCPFEKES